MADRINTDYPPSMASLLGGIVSDIQTLIRQEVALPVRTAADRVVEPGRTTRRNAPDTRRPLAGRSSVHTGSGPEDAAQHPARNT